MFDKLIASDEQGAEFKTRGRYFMVSTVVVGILFLSAVVFSLYAADISLSSGDLAMMEILAPVSPDKPEPVQPKQSQPQSANTKNNLPSRQANIQRIEENPLVPDSISVAKNTQMSRPPGRFIINDGPESTGSYAGSPNGTKIGGNGNSSADSGTEENSYSETVKLPDPPKFTPKKETLKGPVSMGVITGKALSLPKPPYSAAAISVNAQGSVNVQVVIDENGRVLSAKAISGHPLLRGAAQNAAMKATFGPTLLSNVPVKVTGVIVYKFSRN